jgi:hypothetical protein
MNNEELTKKLFAALDCLLALDEPCTAGKYICETHNIKPDTRSVRKFAKETLKLAKEKFNKELNMKGRKLSRKQPPRWACKTQFFDGGRVAASIFPCDANRENSFESTPICDVYIDVFDTKSQAEQFKNDAYNC